MNAPGLIRITGQRYASECGLYSVRRMTVAFRGGGRAWEIFHRGIGIGERRTLRAAARLIDQDKTRRATEILTVGAEVPF